MNILSLFLSVVVGGLLGGAVDSNYQGRISQFVAGPQSAAIETFSPEQQALGKGGWRGEHAGKWLYAASLSYARTGDETIGRQLVEVADRLLGWQEENGYLGCYRTDKRYYVRPSEEAMNVGWDVWINTYMLKGLCAVAQVTGQEKYLDAAERIAGLMYDTFIVRGLKIAQTGEHSGMVGTGSVEPLCDLYALRPSPKVKALILRCIEEMDTTPGLGLVDRLSKGLDVALVGNAKIYEMVRNLTGLAKAYSLLGEKTWLDACLNGWSSIVNDHLTPLGGPWGGINLCQEVFNRDCCFAPWQVTETCSVMEWMHLNKALLDITGEARFAAELEKSVYNALMAARATDGLRWIYYVRTNGVYGRGNEWSCCWSSGMIAVEDIANYLYTTSGKTVYANILSPSTAELTLDNGKKAAFRQEGNYPFEGQTSFVITEAGSWTLAIARPGWADSVSFELNGTRLMHVKENKGYLCIKQDWKAGDRLTVTLPYGTRRIERVREYTHETRWGFNAWYLGHREHYVCYAQGPLVYLADYADAVDKPNPLTLSRDEAEAVQIDAHRFCVNGTEFRPACQMPPYEGSDFRTLWIKVNN